MQEVKREEQVSVQEQAEALYKKGNECRKRGSFHEAINYYIEAARLNPDSPAVEAKKMLDDIMAFYCKDMYNP
jgi:outer membrane protein assembly factor BamD (BamD/ComL family)